MISSLKAQIVLEHTLDTAYSGDRFYVTDIGGNDYKYIFLNEKKNSFSIRNMDMSPYVLDINIPVFDSIKNNFVVMYVTKSLFDCDSSNIEYVYQHKNDNNQAFRIFRTDGTLIFQKDSAFGPYCFGCYGGSNIWRPIINTSAGTKLFLHHSNSPKMNIYALCGTLPLGINDITQPYQFVKIFPNPTSEYLYFEFTLPDNFDQYYLIIFNSNGQELVRKNKIMAGNGFSIEVKNYAGGTYYYSLASKSKVLQTGKFIISK